MRRVAARLYNALTALCSRPPVRPVFAGQEKSSGESFVAALAATVACICPLSSGCLRTAPSRRSRARWTSRRWTLTPWQSARRVVLAHRERRCSGRQRTAQHLQRSSLFASRYSCTAPESALYLDGVFRLDPGFETESFWNHVSCDTRMSFPKPPSDMPSSRAPGSSL